MDPYFLDCTITDSYEYRDGLKSNSWRKVGYRNSGCKVSRSFAVGLMKFRIDFPGIFHHGNWLGCFTWMFEGRDRGYLVK